MTIDTCMEFDLFKNYYSMIDTLAHEFFNLATNEKYCVLWSGGGWHSSEFKYESFRPERYFSDIKIKYALMEDFGRSPLYDVMYIPSHILIDESTWEEYLDKLLNSEE